MTIGKYSLVKLKLENRYDYVEDIFENGRLKLTGKLETIENNPELVEEVFFDGRKTEDMVAICEQLKFLREIYQKEIRRRVYDVQKFKDKSKYFGDNFEPKKK